MGGARYPDYWIDPRTSHVYPLTFAAYRREREAEERPLRAHRTLGPDVDWHVWQRWGDTRSADVEILLTVRPDTSPRIRRLVAEVLRGIRRGRSAADAMRQVSRRFSLPPRRMRACLAACLGFTARARGDAVSRLGERPWLA
jgi:hypothetical protein